MSDNGRYRIPNDNPFANVKGARKEIWAYGFRNPQRLSWYVDPKDPSKNNLIVGVIGLHTWEMIDIVHKGTELRVFPAQRVTSSLGRTTRQARLLQLTRFRLRLTKLKLRDGDSDLSGHRLQP